MANSQFNVHVKVFEQDVEQFFGSMYHEEDDEYISKLTSAMTHSPNWSTLRVTPKSQDQEMCMEDARDELQSLINDDAHQVIIHPHIPDCLCIQVTGPHKVSLLSNFVVVGKQCGEAVLRGSHVFAPGVIGTSNNIRLNEQVSIMANIDGKMPKGTKVTSEQMLTGHVHVGNGKLLMSREEILQKDSKGVAIQITQPIFNTCSFHSFCDSKHFHFFPQNLPSMLVSHLLDPQYSDKILDMCASPGGKSSHIAALMMRQPRVGQKGQVIACDRSANKVKKLKELMEKLDLSGWVDCMVSDGTKPHQSLARQSFDRVLCDAPCSGLGQRPSLGHTEYNMQKLEQTAHYQRKILKKSVEMVKNNGVLVFSTCTISPLENEENVLWLLKEFNGNGTSLVQLDDIKMPWAHKNEYWCGGLKKLIRDERLMRFDPVVNKESIGFFAARFIVKHFNK
ncbi:methyltransferase [Acrasis kona]|uniref:Methyltransferase n=1 Tax=Acrasis kona TaxID=1008807 RepID=A0AAW2ZNL2_9EUKA